MYAHTHTRQYIIWYTRQLIISLNLQRPITSIDIILCIIYCRYMSRPRGELVKKKNTIYNIINYNRYMDTLCILFGHARSNIIMWCIMCCAVILFYFIFYPNRISLPRRSTEIQISRDTRRRAFFRPAYNKTYGLLQKTKSVDRQKCERHIILYIRISFVFGAHRVSKHLMLIISK